MPDVIQRTQREAQQQEGCQCNSRSSLPDRDTPVQNKQQDQDQYRHSAVGIQPDLRVRDIDRFDACKMSHHHVQEAVIELQFPGELIALHGFRYRQSPVRGQQHHRTDPSAQQRIPAKPEHPGHKPNRSASPCNDQAYKEIKHRKDAEHETDVIIAPDPIAQSQAVQASPGGVGQPSVASDPADLLDPAADQGKHRNRIQPHQVEIVADHEIAEGKHGSECHRQRERSGIAVMHIPGESPPAQSDLQQDHQIHEITHICLRHQHDQEIERAGQIVGIGRPEVVPETCRK